jgi:hypothetical protein
MSGPTIDHFARLTALGLRPHWLRAPQPGTKSSGKAPVDAQWQRRPYSPEAHAPPFEHANLGLRTGRVEGAPLQVVVVDLDSPEALAWAREHLPPTPMRTATASGEHWYYRAPNTGKIPNKCRFTLENGQKLEIDVRGDNGNVVVAPSLHPSGHVYSEPESWDALDKDTIPTYDPNWLNGRKQSRAMGRPKSEASDDEAPELPSAPLEPPTERPGVQPEQFQLRLYEACNAQRGGASAVAALRAMARGDDYAPNGERNATLFQAIRLLAEWFPDATDDQLEAFARDSVVRTGSKTPEQELQNFRDVLRRSREKFAEQDHWFLRLAATGVAPTGTLVQHGADLRQRLLLVFDNKGYAIMRSDGTYNPNPIQQSQLHPLIDHEHNLGWAERAGLAQFQFTDAKGKQKPVSWNTLVRRHGWPIHDWRGAFSATHSYVDGDVFVEAIAPRRADLTPLYNDRIETWLRALAGDRAGLLLDWLATFPRLDEPTPALILIGARKAGKNLLAEGAARLWKHGVPTPFESTTADFNEALQQCPLLFADEKLPVDGKGRSKLDEHIRQLVTARTHAINRKYKPVVTAHGCVRIIVATNHQRFAFSNMNEESKAALSERILHVDVSDAARAYLESLGGRAATREWVEGDALARHILWLAETRDVRPGSRLLVDGNGRGLIDVASSSDGVDADLSEWLCRYLAEPSRASIGNGAAGVIAGAGELWVSHIAFDGGEDVWRRFVRHTRSELPSTTALGRALAGLAGEVSERKQVPGTSKRSKYHKIDVNALLTWADRYGHDVDAIKTTIGVVNNDPDPCSSDPATSAAPDARDDAGSVRGGATVAEMAVPEEVAEPVLNPLLAQLHADGATHVLLPTSTPGMLRELSLSELFGSAEPSNDNAQREDTENASTRDADAAVSERGVPGNYDRALDGRELVKKTRAKKEARVKERPAPEQRTDEYYTPESGPPWYDALARANVRTEAQAVEFFAPLLLAAQDGHPSAYYRTVHAYRAYRAALRAGNRDTVACVRALQAWCDVSDPPFVAASCARKDGAA